jgi:fatty acid desaturase
MVKGKKDNFFEVNSHKATVRVATNSIMMGGLFLILTLIWTGDPAKFNIFVVSQLILAVPLLYVSTLAYLKIGYSEKVFMWDILGWFTNNIGSIFILNAVGLMTAAINKDLAVLYFLFMIVFMLMYSIINIIYNPQEKTEKIFKFLFFLIVLAIGGLLPLLLGWLR